MAFARNEFALNRRQPDGATLREHLQSGARQSGIVPDELKVQCPVTMMGLWYAWLELDAGRSSGTEGHNPIGWQDIAAWAALTGQHFSPEDVAAIRAVDRAFLSVANSAKVSNSPV